MRRSLATSCSNVRSLPSSVEAKPHRGESQGRRPEQAPDVVGPERRRLQRDHQGMSVPSSLRRLATTAPVARLATIDGDGRPHLVPCCFALDGDVAYSVVDHKPKRTTALRRLDNIAANPEVAVLADRYADDWTQLWWVRLDGTARVVTDGPEHERAIALLTAKYPQYRATPPSGAVVAIDVVTFRSWAAAPDGRTPPRTAVCPTSSRSLVTNRPHAQVRDQRTSEPAVRHRYVERVGRPCGGGQRRRRCGSGR